MSGISNFTFTHPLRVRWAECDAQGIVFNVNYFLYFDVGMTEYLRALGFEGDQVVEFFTVHAEADYRAPARFDDEVEVAIRCVRIGKTSMTLKAAIFRGDEVLTDGSLTYVHADVETQKKSPIPAAFVERIMGFEKTPPERGRQYR
ncbi:MAG: acyl-CoA thioesterase [Alphaproteobacteria bacterium]|nr:acyl-CoA thioesterase [Alphaproteobacteria bacterium]